MEATPSLLKRLQFSNPGFALFYRLISHAVLLSPLNNDTIPLTATMKYLEISLLRCLVVAPQCYIFEFQCSSLKLYSGFSNKMVFRKRRPNLTIKIIRGFHLNVFFYGNMQVLQIYADMENASNNKSCLSQFTPF